MFGGLVRRQGLRRLPSLRGANLVKSKVIPPCRRLIQTTTGAANFERNQKIQKWVLSLVGVSFVSYGLWWYYWPHNPFPTSVATILRKGLWAESDKENFDYEKALKIYIDALDECKHLKMDPISDEYTGIELKIAEMYEKQMMFNEANGIYLELSYRFYDALTKPGLVPEDRRPDLIRRDLRVLIKSLEMGKDISKGKRNLLSHLLLAQEEILTRSPELKEFFDQRRKRTEKLFQGKVSESEEFKTFVNSENIKLNDEGYMILDLQKNSSAWEPFKEEFFTARDLYTAYCLSDKDLTAALSCKMTTVEWMIMADMPPGQILLSQANLGSLLYLQSEKFESDIYQINLKCEEDEKLKNDKTIIKALRTLNRNKETCQSMATQCYDSVVQFAKKNNKLRFNLKDQLDPSAAQAIALSTYGLGVLNLHNGVLSKAERLLNDSISMAREIDFTELLKEAENELDKVNKAKSERMDKQE
ncbi:hypothetical protein Kpol_1018p153 [Vanderwaltozyma polyspora DSM 70294]|uniref:Mitochondrial inner membrane i-AAA protease supercomplex subunit MGR3 n=1 Tax=Vanderwaltozyma polyspora (strain ATCC 22028 / DSM 70294 / BCRC 21397 / CBS 2163 / NBRC 10782 / NRRL Y-8283 / UCD 57-17) TaxID=436907 RepID=A7TDZ4_VANPO|nr:uncharacterized protein Kpol_1018p153 [Vanderwaltozyma polyspora DSM 70294]EDO19614.1 hypothetical protein Kpol_1018p153 [Vanderwaltozyma polyspora DSM 70294]